MGNTYVMHSHFELLFTGAHSLQVVFGKVLEGINIVHKIG